MIAPKNSQIKSDDNNPTVKSMTAERTTNRHILAASPALTIFASSG